jgi:hypothetical protein
MASQTPPGRIGFLAEALGVSSLSLQRLGACWSTEHKAFAFPMCNPGGEIIGVRLRSYSGKKWCIPGSHNGLFISDGQIGDQVQEIVICEGPTSTAAALDMGLFAIGRPSCSAYVAETVDICAGYNVVIIGDRDEAKTRPDGTVYHPGQDGANALAAAMVKRVRSLKLVYPLRGKDARAWKQAGCTAAIVRSVINNALEWKP